MGDQEEFKVYKVKPYLNSDREPFGLTINGKSKEYIAAHAMLKSMIKKGKQYPTDEGNIKVLDVTNNKAMVNAIVEIQERKKGGNKGNVELKIYNPSLNKKKGATLELRKMSSFDHSYVVFLRRVVGNITSKPKLFTCDVCKWQTKFGSALKAHKTRIHGDNQYSFDICKFQGKDSVDLKDHVDSEHKLNNKRTKVCYKCKVQNCLSTFDSERKLKEHDQGQHSEPDLSHSYSIDMESPSCSPHRKKSDCQVDDIEMIDLEIEANALVSNMLENRIRELENIMKEMEEQRKKDHLYKLKLETEISKFKTKSPSSNKTF